MWLLSTGNRASATKELNFKFYLILINLHLSVNIYTRRSPPYRRAPKKRSADGMNDYGHSSVAMVKLRSNNLKGGRGAEESLHWADPFHFDLLGSSPPLVLHIQVLPPNHAVTLCQGSERTGQQVHRLHSDRCRACAGVCASRRSLACPSNKG